MIYDCFTFFNEIGMLMDQRIRRLEKYVDRFVLVEGTRTFQGEEKPLYFKDEWWNFSTWLPKIEHIIYNYEGPDDDWQREWGQRNAIMQGLKDAKPDDIVIISDIDEIPTPEAIKKYHGGIAALEMDMYYYNMNTRCKHKWHAARITTRKTLDYMTPNEVRLTPDVDYVIPNAGEHRSCFGGVKKIQEKMRACSHRCYDKPEFTNTEHLEQCIKEGKDFLGREGFELVNANLHVDMQ